MKAEGFSDTYYLILVTADIPTLNHSSNSSKPLNGLEKFLIFQFRK